MTVWLILWWVLVTAVLLAGCILAYRKRKSEAAENNFSYPGLRIRHPLYHLRRRGTGLRPVLWQPQRQQRGLLPYCCPGLGAGSCDHAGGLGARGSGAAGSLLYYAALAAAMAVFFVGLATGGLGYVNRIPAEGDVDYIRVDLPGYHFDDSKETYLYSRTRSLTVDAVLPEDEDVMYKDDVTSLSVEPKLQKAKSTRPCRRCTRPSLASTRRPTACEGEGDYHCLLTYTLKNGEELERNYILPGLRSGLGRPE